MPNIGELIARIGFKLDASGLNKAEQRVKGFSTRSSSNILSIGTALKTAFVGAGAAAALRFAKESLDAFDKQAAAVAQVRQGLISTQGVSGKALDGLLQDAADLQKTTLFGDEDILKNVTAQLLTFTNISGEAFERTQKAALDLATRLDGDLKGAAIQLGKALNDPVANLSALSRSGIQFSEEQKTVIKSLVETNRLAEAQALILDELTVQYGGAAEAAAKAGTGPIKQLGNTFGDLTESIGALLAVGLVPMARELQSAGGWLDAFNQKLKGVNLVAQSTFRIFGGGVARDFKRVKEETEDVTESFGGFNTSLVQFGLNLDKIPPKVEPVVVVTDAMRKAAQKAAEEWEDTTKAVDAFSDELEEGEEYLVSWVGELGLVARGVEEVGEAILPVVPQVEQLRGVLTETGEAGGVNFAAGIRDGMFLAADTVRDFTGTAQSLLMAGGPWGQALAGGLELMEAFGVDLNGIFRRVLDDVLGAIGGFVKGIGDSLGIGGLFSGEAGKPSLLPAFIESIERDLDILEQHGQDVVDYLTRLFVKLFDTFEEGDPRLEYLIDLLESFGINVQDLIAGIEAGNRGLDEMLIHFESLPPAVEGISEALAEIEVLAENFGGPVADSIGDAISVLEDFDEAMQDHFIDTFNTIDDDILADFQDELEGLGLVLQGNADYTQYYTDVIREAEEAQRKLEEALKDGSLSVDEFSAAWHLLQGRIEEFEFLLNGIKPVLPKKTPGDDDETIIIPPDSGGGGYTSIGRLTINIDRASLNGLQVGLVRPFSDWLLDIRNFAAIAGGFETITAPNYSPNRWMGGLPPGGGQTLRLLDHNFQEILSGTIESSL